MHCRGYNPDESPCGNLAEVNGFCSVHQDQATKYIIANLNTLDQELKALQKMHMDEVDPIKLDAIRRQISEIRHSQQRFGSQCYELPDCRAKMQSLAMNIDLLLAPDGELVPLPRVVMPDMTQVDPTERLRFASQNLANLSQTSSIDSTLREWEVAKRQEQLNHNKVLELQARLDDVGAQTERERFETRREMEMLVRDINKAQNEKKQADAIAQNLQMTLANTQAQSANITEQYVQHTAKLQDELDKYKAIYQTVQSREIGLSESLKQFEKSEQELESRIRDLKESYEQKMRALQDDYANKVQQGGHILSEREQELQADIRRLEKALNASLQDLEKSNQTNKTALMDLQSSERPCGDLAQELLAVKERMTITSRNMLALQEERDNLVSRKAEYEVQYQRRLAEGQTFNNTQITKLNQDLQNKNREIMSKQQELTELHAALSSLKATSENKIAQLNMQLLQVGFELKQFQDTQGQQTRMLQEKERMLGDQARSQRMDLEFKLRQSETELQRKYEASFKDLENRIQTAQAAQNQQRQELVAVQARLNGRESMLNQKQASLDQNQALFESKMAEFARQKDQLNAAMAQAQQRGDQLANLEQDYRRRVDALRQTAAVDREQSQAELQSLKAKLSDALQARSLIQANLTQCATTRDNMMLQVNAVTQENARLKNQFASLQAQFEQAQVQHSITVEKLRTDANHLQNNVALCASQLEEIPAIHEHNKQLEAKMAYYRSETEKHERELDDVRMNLTKSLAEKDFAAQRIQELQTALKSCDTGKQLLQSNYHASTEQIRDLQRMTIGLENAVEKNAQEFEHVIRNREMERKRHDLQQKSREMTMTSQLKELQMRSEHKTNQIRQLQNQKAAIAGSLVDAAVVNAEQVQALTNNQLSYAQRPTGRSRLVTQ